jgi:hypothetical protein
VTVFRASILDGMAGFGVEGMPRPAQAHHLLRLQRLPHLLRLQRLFCFGLADRSGRLADTVPASQVGCSQPLVGRDCDVNDCGTMGYSDSAGACNAPFGTSSSSGIALRLHNGLAWVRGSLQFSRHLLSGLCPVVAMLYSWSENPIGHGSEPTVGPIEVQSGCGCS